MRDVNQIFLVLFPLLFQCITYNRKLMESLCSDYYLHRLSLFILSWRIFLKIYLNRFYTRKTTRLLTINPMLLTIWLRCRLKDFCFISWTALNTWGSDLHTHLSMMLYLKIHERDLLVKNETKEEKQKKMRNKNIRRKFWFNDFLPLTKDSQFVLNGFLEKGKWCSGSFGNFMNYEMYIYDWQNKWFYVIWSLFSLDPREK